MNTPEAANSLQASILDRLSKGEETAAAFKRYLHAPAHQKAMEELEKAVIDAKHLGIDIDRKGKHTPAIYFSGFWSQGDGACFEGSYRYKKGWRSALLHEFGPGDTLNELLSIGQSLQEIQSKQFYKLEATCRHHGHYQHSGCMSVEVEHAEDRYRDIGDAEGEIRDQLRLFADWIYGRLGQDHDWLTSDEQVDESIRANEYTFNEDGGFEG